MLHRCFARAVLVAAAALGPAASVHAAFFSFASDSADRAWTFTGSGSTFGSTSLGSSNPVVLNIDDNNGSHPELSFSCNFISTATLTFAGDVNVGGSVSHNYMASGSYSFTDIATGTTIFTATYSGQLFTARGAAGSWFSTAAMAGDNSAGSVSMLWGGANLPDYGLASNTTYDIGFSFGLDSINTSGVIPYGGQSPGVSLANSLPAGTWFAESSFVAETVPGPAGLVLLAGGIQVLGGRRQRVR